MPLSGGFLAREQAHWAEVALLAKLRERKAPLSDLLAKGSDDWGYEDPRLASQVRSTSG